MSILGLIYFADDKCRNVENIFRLWFLDSTSVFILTFEIACFHFDGLQVYVLQIYEGACFGKLEHNALFRRII